MNDWYSDLLPRFCFCFLAGLSERVADIKTRAHAMKCLTTFSEAVGPGFIFERVSMLILYGHIFLLAIRVCLPCLSI